MTLPGNPYAERAERFAGGINEWMGSEGITDATMIAATIDRQTEATLSLVFEQREANELQHTANLMYAVTNVDVRIGLTEDDLRVLRDEIRTRLGLEG